MFVINEKETGLSQGIVGSLESIFQSINEPKIAAIDRPAEPTKAFIALHRADTENLHLQIVLFLTQSKVRVVYDWESGGFPEDLREELESEALDFVENMGFMMDNLNVGKLDAKKKAKLAANLPIFEEAEQDLSDLAELAETDLQEIEEIQELHEFAELAERGAEESLSSDADLLDLEKELDLPPEVSEILEPLMKDEVLPAKVSGASGEEEVSQAVLDASQEALDLLEMEFSRDDLDLDAELDLAVSSIQSQAVSSDVFPSDVPASEVQVNAMPGEGAQGAQTGTMPSPKAKSAPDLEKEFSPPLGVHSGKDLLIRLMASF